MERKYDTDYRSKIKAKLIYDSTIKDKEQTASDINNLIIFLNYCFLKKNNFFVENFNSTSLKNISIGYNKIKTNILTNDIMDLFVSVDLSSLKSILFIVTNAINNYKIIKNNNTELCSIISRDSLKRIHYLVNQEVKKKNQK